MTCGRPYLPPRLFSVIEAYSVTVMLRSLEMNLLQPSSTFRHLIRALSRQKDKKAKRQRLKREFNRIQYCDVRAVSHSCDVFIVFRQNVEPNVQERNCCGKCRMSEYLFMFLHKCQRRKATSISCQHTFHPCDIMAFDLINHTCGSHDSSHLRQSYKP